MNEFFSGMLSVGYLVAATYFFRFWSQTHDRLFRAFGVAFAVLALQRTALTMLAQESEWAIFLYAVRALAFLLIIWAIVDKNRQARAA